MKKLLFPVLAATALGWATTVSAVTFVSVTDNNASPSSPATPWTYGVGFTVASTPITITDIQYFNAKSGNLIRYGLWAVGAANGYGNSLRAGSVLNSTGEGGYTSVGDLNGGPVTLNPGAYVLGISGFSMTGSLGDTLYADSVPVLTNPEGLFVAGSLFDFQATAAIGGDPNFYNPANFAYPAIVNQSVSGGGRFKSVNFTYNAVPEPETYALVAGAVLMGFGLWRRRQAK